MKIIIDGYNVIHKLGYLGDFVGNSLQEAREKFCSYLTVWRRQHTNTDILVVFDGIDELYDGKVKNIMGIKCIFSRTREEADGRIIKLISDNTNQTQSIIVVTNDNPLSRRCKHHKAQVKDYPYLTLKPSTNGPDKIPPPNEKQITKELLEKWVDQDIENEDLDKE